MAEGTDVLKCGTDEPNDDKRQTSVSERTSSGHNPVTVNSLTYIGTLAIFIAALELPSLPDLPYPVIKSMLVAKDFAQTKCVKYLFMSMWCVHFIRRTLEVLFVHRYKRRMPIVECIGAPIYYWFFALWIAWSSRHDLGYKPPFTIFIVLGGLIFLAGEMGNCFCHIQLRRLRDETSPILISSTSNHIMPHGVFFNHLSCPHYLFEIITWFGFFLTTWTLSSLVFLLATTITLVIYSQKKHKAYVQEFDGRSGRKKYPANRKALIPFVF